MKLKMNLRNLSSVFSMCTKNWLPIIVLLTVIPSMLAQPLKVNGSNSGFGLKKSCGPELVARVDRICQSRGGHMTYTTARRFRRGIVNECCTNKCADHHLYAYCSDDKQLVKTSESIETPVWQNDILDAAESRIVDVQPLLEAVNSQLNVEMKTESSISYESTSKNPRYHDVLVNGNVDTKLVDRIIKTLPRNSNDYQVGTVPPEYLMKRYIPSRARIIPNF